MRHCGSEESTVPGCTAQGGWAGQGKCGMLGQAPRLPLSSATEYPRTLASPAPFQGNQAGWRAHGSRQQAHLGASQLEQEALGKAPGCLVPQPLSSPLPSAPTPHKPGGHHPEWEDRTQHTMGLGSSPERGVSRVGRRQRTGPGPALSSCPHSLVCQWGKLLPALSHTPRIKGMSEVSPVKDHALMLCGHLAGF